MSTGAQEPQRPVADKAVEFVWILAEIDAVVPAEVAETLLPGASAKTLEQLSRAVLKGRRLPDDLAALLSWHNGQAWNSELSPKNNRRLLAITDIIEEWSFLNNPSSDLPVPPRSSWIPILTNDSGDFLVYEPDGPGSGTLLAYWHDDAERPLEYASLSDWAASLLRELREEP